MKQIKVNSFFKIISNDNKIYPEETLNKENKNTNANTNTNTNTNTNINTNTIIDDEYILYFDGCSKGNPGLAGAGAVIYKNGGEIWYTSVFVGENETNNVAEYTGLLVGLNQAVNFGIKSLTVKGDSLLVIKQMRGDYRVNSDSIKTQYKLAKNMSKKFEKIKFAHVYREFNKRADELSNLGLLKNPRYIVY